MLHRREDRGAIEGIRRSFQFCQDDAHIFLRPEQVEEEITSLIGMVRRVYAVFGLEIKYYLSLSDWENHPEKWLGTRGMWRSAEEGLARALERNELPYEKQSNEAAFYGPKIDFVTQNVFGVFEHQCATIQLDFNLPERFDLVYVDSDNSEKRPIVVHRAIFGSFERFIASVIEKTAGKFPVWLAPVQVKVLTISQGSVEYGRKVQERLLSAGVRSEFDDRDDKISFKIRAASKEKVPYILVVGGKEAEKGTVNVRSRDLPEKQEEVALDAFLEKVRAEWEMVVVRLAGAPGMVRPRRACRFRPAAGPANSLRLRRAAVPCAFSRQGTVGPREGFFQGVPPWRRSTSCPPCPTRTRPWSRTSTPRR